MSAGINAMHDSHVSASGGPAVEWLEPPALSLDDDGFIQICSDSCAQLFGYHGPDLTSHHISSLFPQLSGQELLLDGQLNPMLDFLCHCGHPFLAMDRQGGTFKSALNLIRIMHPGSSNLRLIVRPLER